MKCPGCGYERKASDNAPEWQCPSCEIAYNKHPNYNGNNHSVKLLYGHVPKDEEVEHGYIYLYTISGHIEYARKSIDGKIERDHLNIDLLDYHDILNVLSNPSSLLSPAQNIALVNAISQKNNQPQQSNLEASSKKNYFSISKILLLILASLVVFYLFTSNKFLTNRFKVSSSQMQSVITLSNTEINLKELSEKISAAAEAAEECKSYCQINGQPNESCMEANAVLYSNRKENTLLRDYYNTKRYLTLSGYQRQLLEKIKSNIIKIDKNMTTAVSFCNQNSATSPQNIQQTTLKDSTLEVPRINFEIKVKKMPKEAWLKELKGLFPIPICASAMEHEAIVATLNEQHIDLKKCINSVIPKLFNRCKKKYYDDLPQIITQESAKKWGEQMGQCIGLDFAMDYLFPKRK